MILLPALYSARPVACTELGCIVPSPVAAEVTESSGVWQVVRCNRGSQNSGGRGGMMSDSKDNFAGMPKPTLRAYLLGSFQLYVNDKEVPKQRWRSKKALTLFQYLLTRRGTKVPKGVLLELLWPEDDPEAASSRLHPTLYMLRRTLEPDLQAYEQSAYIHNTPGNYWMEEGPSCWVDIEAFKTLCRKSEQLESTDPEHALRLCEEAIALYRDDFLPEETLQDWTRSLRRYYRECFIDVTLRAAQLMMQLHGNVSSAVRFCHEALTHDPYREEVSQALMAHLIKAGRYAEAAKHYRHCADLLRDEFGLSPSPETTALFEQMRRRIGQPLNERNGQPSAVDNEPLICDKATFDTIRNLYVRQQERDGRPVVVLEITPVGATVNEKLRASMRRTLCSVLRRSDLMCWDEGRARVLLLTGRQGSETVMRRIERQRVQDGLPPLTISAKVYEKLAPGEPEKRMNAKPRPAVVWQSSSDSDH